MASGVKAFSGKPTNADRPYQELRTWKAEVLSFNGVVVPAIHLRLLLIWARDIELNPGPTCSDCSKSIRCDAIHNVWSTCQRHFHRTYSRLTRSQNGIQGIVCFFCSGGAAALPPTTTVTSTSELPRRCLHCHTRIRHNIRPIKFQQCSHLAHWNCSGISRYVVNPSYLCPACSLPTTSISTQPMMAMTNSTYAPTALPPTSDTNCLFPHHTLMDPRSHLCLCSCCLRKPSTPNIHSNLKCSACSKTLAKSLKKLLCNRTFHIK